MWRKYNITLLAKSVNYLENLKLNSIIHCSICSEQPNVYEETDVESSRESLPGQGMEKIDQNDFSLVTPPLLPWAETVRRNGQTHIMPLGSFYLPEDDRFQIWNLSTFILPNQPIGLIDKPTTKRYMSRIKTQSHRLFGQKLACPYIHRCKELGEKIQCTIGHVGRR